MPAPQNSFFEYPVTRPFTLRHFTLYTVVFGLIYTVIVTLYAVLAVAYENETVLSGMFNDTPPIWYESFLPTTPVTPKSRKCQYSVMKAGECTPKSSFKADHSAVGGSPVLLQSRFIR